MKITKKLVSKAVLLALVFSITLPMSGGYAAAYPTIIVSAPGDNSVVKINSVNVSGYVTDTSTLRINGTGVPFSGNGFFSYTISNLSEGRNTVIITATGSTGLTTNKYLTVFYDPAATVPVITVSTPAEDYTYQSVVPVSGNIYYDHSLTLNSTIKVNSASEEYLPVDQNGNFSYNANLSPNDNTIIIKAQVTTPQGAVIQETKTLHLKYIVQTVITDIRVDSQPVSDYIAVSNPSVTLEGYANGATTVKVLNNGQTVAAKPGGYFSVPINLSSGGNNILIIASGSGATDTRSLIIYRGPAGPQVYNVTPANGDTVYAMNITVSGTVRDASSVTVNGLAATIANGTFSRSITLTGNQWNSIRIEATGSGGVTTTHDFTVYCKTNPAIFVTTPAVGQVVYSNTVTVSGKVYNTRSDGLTVNGLSTTFNYSTGEFSRVVTLKPGNNTIVVKATGSSGASAEASVPIEYRGGPNIYNLSPVSGVRVTTGSVRVSGTVANTKSDGLRINDTAVTFDGSGNFNKVISLSPGANTITITATDGIATQTKTIQITYDASPIIVITSPKNEEIVTRDSVTITGTVFNTEDHGLYINGETVSFNRTDGSFSKAIDLTRVTNEFEITAYNGGLSTTTSLHVYYRGEPSISVTSHNSGDTTDTPDVIIEGTLFPQDPSEIQTFTIGGVDNKSNIKDGYFRSFPITLDPGDNEIEITAVTKALTTPGGGVIPSREVSRKIKLTYNNGPSITVYSPLDGSTVYSNVVTVRGKLKKADFNTLEIDGKATPVNSDGSFQRTVTLKSGENKIELKAAIGETSATKTITVNYTALAREGAEVKTEVKDGSEIKAFDNEIKIKLAKGSLGTNTTSVLTVEDPSDLDDPPNQSAFVGPLLRLRWEGYKPLKPYKITLQYDNVVVENQAHKVSVFYYDMHEDEWQVLGGVVDAKSRTVSIETDKEGYFVAAVYFRTFDDVGRHWAQRDIEFLVARGAVEGNTGNRFLPDDNVTRAEFVTFLVKTLGLQPYEPDRASYSDVSKDHWGFPYIEAALRAGLVSGISHNQFAPERYLTREEAAVLLARAGNLKTLKDQEVTKIFSSFSDAGMVSMWARNELASAVKSKLLNGSGDGTISPRRYTTRAQAAAMIARLTEVVNKTRK